MTCVEPIPDSQALEQLRQKRAEIVARIEQTRIDLRHLVSSVDQLDGVIRLFDPTAEVVPVGPSSAPPRYAAFKGEVRRAVLDALESAEKPLGSRQIALKLMAERGLDVNDRDLSIIMVKRTSACLKVLRQKGLVRGATSTAGPTQEWEIVR